MTSISEDSGRSDFVAPPAADGRCCCRRRRGGGQHGCDGRRDRVCPRRAAGADRRRVRPSPDDRGLHFKLPWPVDAVAAVRSSRAVVRAGRSRGLHAGQEERHRRRVRLLADRGAGGRGRGFCRSGRSSCFYRGLGDARWPSAARHARAVGPQHADWPRRAELAAQRDATRRRGRARGAGGSTGSRRRCATRSCSGPTRTIRWPLRLGLEVVDVRIRRLNFPTGNQAAVFERMRTERRKIAESYRSAGLAENKMITSQADRQYGELIARAKADAERIRGEAEAESISILNRADAEDPELYRTTANARCVSDDAERQDDARAVGVEQPAEDADGGSAGRAAGEGAEKRIARWRAGVDAKSIRTDIRHSHPTRPPLPPLPKGGSKTDDMLRRFADLLPLLSASGSPRGSSSSAATSAVSCGVSVSFRMTIRGFS